jgi:hypothetical protein
MLDGIDRKEIPTVLPTQTILPDYVQFDSNENLILLVEGGENQYLEFKPFLSFDYAKRCEVKTKGFDVSYVRNSFVGELITVRQSQLSLKDCWNSIKNEA